MSPDEVLDHVEELVAATDLPLSADLENCFAHDPDGVALTVQDAIDAGVTGFSVEDFTGNKEDPRCENYLHGRPDLDDTIRRLLAYEVAGADVLFAPRVAELGVSRVSVGGAFAVAAYGAMVEAATELREQGAGSRVRTALGPGGARWSSHPGCLQSLRATVTSISTAPLRGNAATPTAERVWRPASPKTSARTLLAPSMTAGCSKKSGADDTKPVTVRTRSTRSSEPRACWSTASALRAHTAAASLPSSTVTVSPRRPRQVSFPSMRGS
jgi:hypothetical protein